MLCQRTSNDTRVPPMQETPSPLVVVGMDDAVHEAAETALVASPSHSSIHQAACGAATQFRLLSVRPSF